MWFNFFLFWGIFALKCHLMAQIFRICVFDPWRLTVGDCQKCEMPDITVHITVLLYNIEQAMTNALLLPIYCGRSPNKSVQCNILIMSCREYITQYIHPQISNGTFYCASVLMVEFWLLGSEYKDFVIANYHRGFLQYVKLYVILSIFLKEVCNSYSLSVSWNGELL